MPDSKPRACLYARVSTKDKGQDPTNQLIPLRKLAKERGWKVAEEVIEHESAAGSKLRKQFVRMMESAEQGQYDIISFWSLDRFSREGVTQTLYDLRRLTDLGVEWVSQQEHFLDSTHLGPFRDVIIALIAAVARLETERRSERSKAAVERRRAAGEHVGGKRKEVDEVALEQLVRDNYSHSAIARHLGCSRGTVINRIRELKEQGRL